VYNGQTFYLHHRFPSYLGGTRPRVLLLGEKRGGQPPHHGDTRAFTPRGSTSGRWLLESLPERLWPRVGIANALEEDLTQLYVTLRYPAVVTLGRAAHERAELAQIRHASVPHPQWVRRFHHQDLPEYGELIENVAGTDRNELSWKGAVDG
jgi:hypothetical protein